MKKATQKMHNEDMTKDEISSEKAVHFMHPKANKERDLTGSLYPHMLIEDVHSGIMPFGGRTNNKNFKITVKPQNPVIEKLLINSFPTYHGNPYDIKETICDFIDEVAYMLAYYGIAYYEIVYYYDNSGKPTRFEIVRINNTNINEMFGFYWQYIPKSVHRYRDESNKRFVRLPRKSIVKIVLPNACGGPKIQQKLLSNLAWLSNCTIPNFVMEDMKQQKQQPGYDFMVYQRNSNVYLAKITKHLGWSARGLQRDLTLEMYQLFRYLKFEKTKAIIREHILSQLNKTLKNVGKIMDFNITIEIEGMPTAMKLNEHISKLLSGKMPFAEVVEIMKYDLL